MLSCIIGVVISVVLLVLASVAMGKINSARKTLTGSVRDDLDHAYNASVGVMVLSLIFLVLSGLCFFKRHVKGEHAAGMYWD